MTMRDLLHDSTSSLGHVPQGCFLTTDAITECDVAPTYYSHLQTILTISRHRLSATIALRHPFPASIDIIYDISVAFKISPHRRLLVSFWEVVQGQSITVIVDGSVLLKGDRLERVEERERGSE
uniref:Uncharacterized protein n=1 Tax=Parascaris equorum TaxID=6256 RepID=A0A914S0A0_PAREQ